MLKKIWNWFVVSSADPSKVSLTVKGVLVGIIPILVSILPIFGLKLDATTLGDVAGSIESIINAVLTIVALALGIVGFVRKVYNTLGGKTTQQG